MLFLQLFHPLKMANFSPHGNLMTNPQPQGSLSSTPSKIFTFPTKCYDILLSVAKVSPVISCGSPSCVPVLLLQAIVVQEAQTGIQGGQEKLEIEFKIIYNNSSVVYVVYKQQEV